MITHSELLEVVGPVLIKGLALTAAFAVFAPLLAAFAAPFIG
jgi:hypothetical protein